MLAAPKADFKPDLGPALGKSHRPVGWCHQARQPRLNQLLLALAQRMPEPAPIEPMAGPLRLIVQGSGPALSEFAGQRLDQIGFFPAKATIGIGITAKMTIGCRAAVNRPVQTQMHADAAW